MKTLVEVLTAAGKPTKVVRTADGTRVLVLPYGGRVLGLFSPRSDENFYWTHDALRSVATARAFYARDHWHNSGGDRTWLAPEIDLFFPDFPNRARYVQPRALDPGNYVVTAAGEDFALVNRLSVTFSRTRLEVGLEIAKSFGPAPNPLRHERGLDLAGLEFAGYTQYTSLSLIGTDAAASAPVGLWNLVQMPHGGALLIPTYSRAEPRPIMGSVPVADLRVSDHLVVYRMRQEGEHKIAIRAVATTGRVGYLYASGEHWALIVRNFMVDPSGEYVDVPWDNPAERGYSTQACNVNSALGRFSELEYHIPAIGGDTRRTRCADAAQVWAFRGAPESVRRVLRTLLGADASVAGLLSASSTR